MKWKKLRQWLAAVLAIVMFVEAGPVNLFGLRFESYADTNVEVMTSSDAIYGVESNGHEAAMASVEGDEDEYNALYNIGSPIYLGSNYIQTHDSYGNRLNLKFETEASGWYSFYAEIYENTCIGFDLWNEERTEIVYGTPKGTSDHIYDEDRNIIYWDRGDEASGWFNEGYYILTTEDNFICEKLTCYLQKNTVYFLNLNGETSNRYHNVEITYEKYAPGLTGTLDFDANGGSVDAESREYEYGDLLGELPIPEQEGVSFIGWATDLEGEELVTEETVFHGDMVLYAIWDYSELTITYWNDYDPETESVNNEITEMTVTYGSFSWKNAQEFDELYAKLEYSGEVEESTIKVELTAPDGFSFDSNTMVVQRDVEFDDTYEIVKLYPIYSEEYKDGDTLNVAYKILENGEEKKSGVKETIVVKKNPMEGEIYYRDSFTETLTGPIYAKDLKFNGFKKDSSEYDYNLALLSAYFCAASYKKLGLEKTYEDLGFSNVKWYRYNEYDDTKTVDENSVACSLAQKKYVGNDNKIYTIVNLTIRGTLEKEWYGNFRIGNGVYHENFYNAYCDVLNNLNEYLHTIDTDKEHIKILINGHSRGAAVADLIAIEIKSNQAVQYPALNDVYTYTFAAPASLNTTNSTAEVKNIFNIKNHQDLVVHVPGTYSSPGINKWVNYIYDDDFNGQYNKFIKYFEGMVRTVTYHTWKNAGTEFVNSLEKINANTLINGLGDVIAGAIIPKEDKDVVKEAVKKYISTSFGKLLLKHTALKYSISTEWIDHNFYSNVWNNHAMETYICWLYVSGPEGKFSNINKTHNKTSFKCPVDIAMYDTNGTLVSQIVDNQVVVANGPYCTVDGEEKIFYQDDQDYTFVITGNDNGTMDIAVESYNENGEQIKQENYYGLEVKKGQSSELMVENATDVELISASGTVITPTYKAFGGNIGNLTVSTTVKGSGYVIGDGCYSLGEKVSLYAYEDNGTFSGWYQNNKCISADKEYSFICEKDTTLEARFKSSTGTGSSSGGGGGGGSSSGGSGGSGSSSGSGGGGGGSSSGSGGGGGSSSGGGGGGGSSSGRGGSTSTNNSNTVLNLPPYVVKGAWVQISDKWMFTDNNGVAYKNNWAAIYNPYANPALGQQMFDWFWFDENGYMITGWVLHEGLWYFMNTASDGTQGRMVTKWHQVDGNWYYFNDVSDGTRGAMQTNIVVDGKYVNEHGIWVPN